MLRFIPVLALLLITSPARAEEWRGQAHAFSGNRLRMDGRDLRLLGSDALERIQRCTDVNGKDYACGMRARDALWDMTRGKQVHCVGLITDENNFPLVRCTADGRELGREMVRAGWAVSSDKGYLREEGEARAAKRGMWQGTFQRPADWRRENNRPADWRLAQENPYQLRFPIPAGGLAERGKLIDAKVKELGGWQWSTRGSDPVAIVGMKTAEALDDFRRWFVGQRWDDLAVIE